MELFITFVLLIMFASMLIAAFSFAPWAPSHNMHLKRALTLAELKEGEQFYDLGCGDGRVVICAAKEFGAKATGIEYALPLYIAAKIRVKLSGAKNADIAFGDLFREDLSNANVIYVYGMPNALEQKLRTKLETECKPGTRIVSFMFEIKGWKPVKIDHAPGRWKKDVPLALYSL